MMLATTIKPTPARDISRATLYLWGEGVDRARIPGRKGCKREGWCIDDPGNLALGHVGLLSQSKQVRPPRVLALAGIRHRALAAGVCTTGRTIPGRAACFTSMTWKRSRPGEIRSRSPGSLWSRSDQHGHDENGSCVLVRERDRNGSPHNLGALVTEGKSSIRTSRKAVILGPP